MSETHLNRLCVSCANRCKQNDTARIVECPNFIKKPSEREFRRMVDDLDSAEESAKNIRSRARELIKKALTPSSDTVDTPGTGTSEHAPDSSGDSHSGNSAVEPS